MQVQCDNKHTLVCWQLRGPGLAPREISRASVTLTDRPHTYHTHPLCNSATELLARNISKPLEAISVFNLYPLQRNSCQKPASLCIKTDFLLQL